MTDVKISEKLGKQIAKISKKMTIRDGELSGPIFGHFELVDKKNILVLDRFFDRTTYSSMSSVEFEFRNDFFINKETKKGNKWVGTLHTHPFMPVKPSHKDLETSARIQKELGIKTTAYIIVGKEKAFLWKETNETIKSTNKK